VTTSATCYAVPISLSSSSTDMPIMELTGLYPVYTIKQTSSKYEACIKHSLHKANIEQLEHMSCTCILNAFAGCLLDVCLIE